MRSDLVVQVGNATPTIPSLEKSGIRGTRGSAVPSLCTRSSPGRNRPCVDAVWMTNKIIDRWKSRGEPPSRLHRAARQAIAHGPTDHGEHITKTSTMSPPGNCLTSITAGVEIRSLKLPNQIGGRRSEADAAITVHKLMPMTPLTSEVSPSSSRS
jgi:hypothetical protein